MDYKSALEKKKGQRHQVLKNLETCDLELRKWRRQAMYCEEAQLIIQSVAQQTQEQLKYHISELVTLALASVFDDPYQFAAEFVQRRGRTECDLWFVRDEVRIDPMSASGGGAVDVAAFALQVSLWSLGQPKTRNTMILDEPLKWLKGDDLPEKGAAMIKEISDKIGLQVIMVSHIPDQIESSDKVINVRLKQGKSIVQ